MGEVGKGSCIVKAEQTLFLLQQQMDDPMRHPKQNTYHSAGILGRAQNQTNRSISSLVTKIRVGSLARPKANQPTTQGNPHHGNGGANPKPTTQQKQNLTGQRRPHPTEVHIAAPTLGNFSFCFSGAAKHSAVQQSSAPKTYIASAVPKPKEEGGQPPLRRKLTCHQYGLKRQPITKVRWNHLLATSPSQSSLLWV